MLFILLWPRTKGFFKAPKLQLCTFLLVGAREAFAQGFARITGVVTDPSGAAVKGATITVTQVGTGEGATATTNDEGLFVFPSLRPSRYDLKVTSSGFATFTKTGIVLQADAAVTVNVGPQVGNVDQTVTVEASSAQVDTSTATLSQVVDQRRINDLPLNGRNAAALTTLVAGVVIAPNAQADQGLTKTFPVAVTITSNGTRANQTNYMLDGGNNVDPYTNVNAPFPFPDALQEFSVQTSNYNPEYGQNAGGVVNIVTKSAQLRDRAVQIGDPYGPGACGSTPRCVDYLNPAAFANNAVGTYGTAGKGIVKGPGFATWDVSLMRHIRLTERMDLEFRAEYFNVLSHPNFNDPASNNQAPFTGAGSAFGRITGALDPRIGQLSLKLHF